MKVNSETITRAALNLVNRAGIDDLTLRLLARELNVQPSSIYWHFKNKRELIEAMANTILAADARRLVPSTNQPDWKIWIVTFAVRLRQNLLAYRDAARIVAESRPSNPEYLTSLERIARRLTSSGFNPRQVVLLLSTIYNFALGFVMEEQAVFPRPKERSPRYNISKRMKKLDPQKFPTLHKTARISLEHFDLRYREALSLILGGATRLSRSLPVGPIENIERTIAAENRRENRSSKKRKP